MKKFLSLVLAISVIAGTITACSSNDTSSSAGTTTSATEQTTSPTTSAPANQTTEGGTAGYSVYTYISSSKAPTAEANGSVEVNSYIAYTAIGADGKIFKAGLDAAQSKVAFDAAGQVVADLTAKPKTKNELGDEYGMKKASAIGKEWFEQAKALADWTIGKTLNDVKNVKTKEDNGKVTFDDADLVSSVTVTATSMQTPLMKSDEHKLTGTVAADGKIGMGVVTSIAKSKSATAEANGTGQVDSTLAVVALDSSGKITACAFDNIQSKVSFAADGTYVTDLSTIVKTKMELKEDYGMAKSSAIGKEWYQQSEAFAAWCIGKTVSEVTSMQTKKVDDNHPQVPDVADLASSVTISVGDLLEALTKAAAKDRKSVV